MTIATWLTGNRADAEDVVQEACLRALKAMSTYAGGSPRAWTLTIVRNCAFAWLRKNRSNDLVSFDHLGAEDLAIAESGGDLKTSFASTPEAELISRADAESLMAGIDSLPPEFREVLVLRDIQGLNYQEIAQVTSVPLGTVMSRLARARRRLINKIRSPSEASKAGPASASRSEMSAPGDRLAQLDEDDRNSFAKASSSRMFRSEAAQNLVSPSVQLRRL